MGARTMDKLKVFTIQDQYIKCECGSYVQAYGLDLKDAERILKERDMLLEACKVAHKQASHILWRSTEGAEAQEKLKKAINECEGGA
jgi:hypothetical protein